MVRSSYLETIVHIQQNFLIHPRALQGPTHEIDVSTPEAIHTEIQTYSCEGEEEDAMIVKRPIVESLFVQFAEPNVVYGCRRYYPAPTKRPPRDGQGK